MKIKILFLTIAAMCLFCAAAFSQAIDTTLVADPAGIVSIGNLEAMTAAITLILTFLSGVIPGIKNIKSGVIRAIAVGVVVVIAVVEFRLGWFSKDSFDAIIKTLIPTFAYSGFAWEFLKTLLGFFNIDLKGAAPGNKTVSVRTTPSNVNTTL